MMKMKLPRTYLAALLASLACGSAWAAQTPAKNQSPLASEPAAASLPSMLSLPGSGEDPERIVYANLPVLKGTHAVVCPLDEQWKFQLHNYLLHHDGKYWCMWSHGPVVEDEPTQHVRYS